MLYIRTGLQGHGKTLNTIKEVDTKAKAQSRPVYFHNVTDLDSSKLQAEWYSFDDPLKWFELPENSIVVVDEAQGWFGVRDPRKEVPEHISHFEIMRKRGYEVHLITQDPRFIDVHARRLCNKHVHYWRIFGSAKISRYEIERIYNDVEKINGCKDASRTFVTLDKRYFGVYSSAQAGHHFKFNPSRKAVLSAVGLLVCGYLAFRGFDQVYGSSEPETPAEPVKEQGASNPVSDIAKSLIPGVVPEGSKQLTPEQYVASRIPRVANVPSSAPFYDELTKPKSYPRLHCMASTDPDVYARNFARMASATVNGKQTVCQCYTQQATKVATDFAFCMNVVENGYFDPAIADRSLQALDGAQQQGGHIPSQPYQPDSIQPQQQSPAVTVVSYEKGRFLW